LILSAYLEASGYVTMGKHAILLVDDIDTSVASTTEDRRYTVNSQIVNGTFMNIADYPTMVAGKKTNRIPIVFTGNDLTNLYAPLRRNGRMKVFSWEPDTITKEKIINKILIKHINEQEIPHFNSFIQEFIEKPISFFSDLKSELFDDLIMNLITRPGGFDILKIDKKISSLLDTKINVEHIRTKAEAISNANLKSYN
jgi:hypothetical protein